MIFNSRVTIHFFLPQKKKKSTIALELELKSTQHLDTFKDNEQHAWHPPMHPRNLLGTWASYLSNKRGGGAKNGKSKNVEAGILQLESSAFVFK